MKNRQQIRADWSFPESPLDLTCTFLLVALRITKLCGPVATGCVGRGFVDALLHPLHDQVQQRYDRLVHLCACCRARLEVWNSMSSINKKNNFQYAIQRLIKKVKKNLLQRIVTLKIFNCIEYVGNIPVFISQLLGLLLLNLPLVGQVCFVSYQHDIWILTVGVGLQLAWK